MFINDVVEEFSSAIGLLRRSTDELRQEHSIESQMEQIERTCQQSKVIIDRNFNPSGAENLAGYVCRDGSGLSFDREDFDAALSYCKEHNVKQIVVSSLDRLSREETGDFSKRLEALRNAGIDLLISVHLPTKYDLSKSSVRKYLNEQAKFAHESSVQTSINVLRGLKGRAYSMAIPPVSCFGFDVVKDSVQMPNGKIDNSNWYVVPIKEELDAIREVGLMFIGGATTTKLVDYLNRRGLKVKSTRKKNSNPFIWNTLKGILRNPIFRGDRDWETLNQLL